MLVSKVLNNNVIIADDPHYGEVVVIGKGIGFGRAEKDIIDAEAAEKMFILRNRREQEQYKQLLPQVDEQLIEVMNEAIRTISSRIASPLNEHIHVALTDHIAFAIKRMEKGISFQNPFLYETKEIYPEEYELATYVVQLIKERIGTSLDADEIGFVALHIHSAITNRPINEVRGHSELISDLVNLIEQNLEGGLNRSSLDYSRLLTHLRFAIERIYRGEEVKATDRLSELLAHEYPEMYSLAWKLTKVMEKRLGLPVYKAEASYLTVHLQRLAERDHG
ncbi:glucose PTS transporter transcription antiterminator GlcT [Saccharibacillus sp. JS10]|uniref:glucose PTS transporter transcription antiterminator GlcT n=1 Tax=Saccharibacillus sp. JS10 TaxID=2950552 RepID=UPI00210DA1B1|nr:transcription antiterminator [Saccharibacillus sp. JS10]MCQ4086242.1 transcription antiterminator [Saccharibacillus sp. JS10]